MAQHHPGTLIIIGGHEDKEHERVILKAVARRVGSEPLVVATVATDSPDDSYATYNKVFRALGVRHLRHLSVSTREDATSPQAQRTLDGAGGVFFTGGDQLRITSQLGDTPVWEALHQIFDSGGLIAGTSAGASVMCETMLVSGESEASPRGEGLRMAPGLGLFENAIVDQHFAERGRMGRLLGAVAQNPRMLGIGIDENTAIVVERKRMRVIGAGAVYVADGSSVTFSNPAETDDDKTLSIFGITLHVLATGDVFNLEERTPGRRPAAALSA